MLISSLCRRVFLATLFLCLPLMVLADDKAEKKPAQPDAVKTETTLKPGDTVVFLGDSITQQGDSGFGYVSMIRMFFNQHQPELKVRVVNAGISGNKVGQLEERIDKVLSSSKPNVVIIYIGINDVWHSQSGQGTKIEDFEKGLGRLIEKVKAASATPILCTPSVIGEKTVGENSLDKMLDEYSDISRKVAKENKIRLIDLRQEFVAHLKENNKENAERGILTADRVHLNKAGNLLVARSMVTELLGEEEAKKVGTPPAAAPETTSTENKPETKPMPATPATPGTPGTPAAAKPGKLLRHVVLFKFKSDLTEEQVKEVIDAFNQLPKKIREVHSFEWGTDNSPEKLADGFTHCFFITFRDEAARTAYLPHPEHLKFVELVKPRLEKVLVVDYWTP